MDIKVDNLALPNYWPTVKREKEKGSLGAARPAQEPELTTLTLTPALNTQGGRRALCASYPPREAQRLSAQHTHRCTHTGRHILLLYTHGEAYTPPTGMVGKHIPHLGVIPVSRGSREPFRVLFPSREALGSLLPVIPVSRGSREPLFPFHCWARKEVPTREDTYPPTMVPYPPGIYMPSCLPL